jgi:hypothetical protein
MHWLAAAGSVTTRGINWESIATLVTAIIVVVGAITGYVGRQITNSVTNLGDRLEAKLETKERVSQIDRRLTVLETRANVTKRSR